MDFIEFDAKERKTEWSMSDLQSHSYWELYFLLDGKRRFFLKDRIYDINAITVCVIPPFCMHKTEGGGYKRININVSPDLLDEDEEKMLLSLGRTVVFTLDAKKSELIIELLKKGADDSTAENSDTPRESFLHVILHLIKNDGLLPYQHADIVSSNEKDALILNVASYIHEHYMDDFSISDLCQIFYISKNTLCSRFMRVMNCSVMEYRQKVRINEAKELLVSTRLGVKEIAEKCGFSGANYFSLIFKREVGISPLNYRKSK